MFPARSPHTSSVTSPRRRRERTMPDNEPDGMLVDPDQWFKNTFEPGSDEFADFVYLDTGFIYEYMSGKSQRDFDDYLRKARRSPDEAWQDLGPRWQQRLQQIHLDSLIPVGALDDYEDDDIDYAGPDGQPAGTGAADPPAVLHTMPGDAGEVLKSPDVAVGFGRFTLIVIGGGVGVAAIAAAAILFFGGGDGGDGTVGSATSIPTAPASGASGAGSASAPDATSEPAASGLPVLVAPCSVIRHLRRACSEGRSDRLCSSMSVTTRPVRPREPSELPIRVRRSRRPVPHAADERDSQRPSRRLPVPLA